MPTQCSIHLPPRRSNRFPGHFPNPLPDHHTHIPTHLPPHLSTYLPTLLPTHLPTQLPAHLPTYLRGGGHRVHFETPRTVGRCDLTIARSNHCSPLQHRHPLPSQARLGSLQLSAGAVIALVLLFAIILALACAYQGVWWMAKTRGVRFHALERWWPS